MENLKKDGVKVSEKNGFWDKSFESSGLYQPLILAVLFSCMDILKDPNYPIFPCCLLGNIIGSYILLTWITVPIWKYFYSKVILVNPFLIRRVFSQWFVYSLLGLFPAALAPAFLTLLLEMSSLHIVWAPILDLIFISFFSSLIGVGLSLHASHQKIKSKQSFGMVFVILFVLLVLFKSYGFYVLTTPDHGRAIKSLAKIVSLTPKDQKNVKKVYCSFIRGYFLAGGDPVIKYFRFDTDADTIKKIIENLKLKSVKNHGTDYYIRGAEFNIWEKWWSEGDKGKEEAFADNDINRLWVDWQHGRVFLRYSER